MTRPEPRRSRRWSRGRSGRRRDRGALDVSIEMLVGLSGALFAMLLVFETTSFWHARNVLDEAAAEGARVAAAHDGSCAQGVVAANALMHRQGGRWVDDVTVSCVENDVITVVITGRSAGVIGGPVGFPVRVSESAPKER